MGVVIAALSSVGLVIFAFALSVSGIAVEEERQVRGSARRGEMGALLLCLLLVALLSVLGAWAAWTLFAPSALNGGMA
jgi:hypothetical protein